MFKDEYLLGIKNKHKFIKINDLKLKNLVSIIFYCLCSFNAKK